MRRLLALIVACGLIGSAYVCADPAIEALSEGGAIGPGGLQVICDLPLELRKANIASPPPNGPGCCVFRSLDHASRWQNVPALNGFPEWMVANRIQGGGYPGKVDDLIPKIAKDRGLEMPGYIQHTGGDLEFLYQAIATSRMPCITYAGMDMHYGQRKKIAHMINLVYLDPPTAKTRMAAVLDNNFVGDQQLVWMTAAELKQRWLEMSGGWAIVLLAPAPPPPPRVK